MEEILEIPRHIALIMDGNGRWAQQRGLPRLAGHRAGAESAHRLLGAWASGSRSQPSMASPLRTGKGPGKR